jgi:hypothetical protein
VTKEVALKFVAPWHEAMLKVVVQHAERGTHTISELSPYLQSQAAHTRALSQGSALVSVSGVGPLEANLCVKQNWCRCRRCR